jgi:predicted RNA-binding Zn ribbon-like protein
LVHVAGHPALDFVGTVAERTGAHVEQFVSPQLLADWYVAAGIVTLAPAVDAVDLDRARGLREQLYRVITAWMEDRPSGAAARRAVNETAAGTPPVPSVDGSGAVRIVGDAEACLAAVARSALGLMSTTPRHQVRWCADSECTHLFLDTSRAQQRRWCDMASCGTRNKQRQHRARIAAPVARGD